MDLTPFERLGVRNAVNRIVGPFVEKVEHELEEMRLSIEGREEPNYELYLRRLRMVVRLVKDLKKEQERWNEEV